MSRIHSAADKCKIENRRLFFDTNIWMLIEGYNGTGGKFRSDIYSNFFSQSRDLSNTIVTNDYVINEFYNRCIKIEYDTAKSSFDGAARDFPPLKVYRKSAEFKETAETIRDTCLNIIDDCELVRIFPEVYSPSAVVKEACQGILDISDIIIRQFCEFHGLVLVTDDGDYEGCGLEIVTANKKIMKSLI